MFEFGISFFTSHRNLQTFGWFLFFCLHIFIRLTARNEKICHGDPYLFEQFMQCTIKRMSTKPDGRNFIYWPNVCFFFHFILSSISGFLFDFWMNASACSAVDVLNTDSVRCSHFGKMLRFWIWICRVLFDEKSSLRMVNTEHRNNEIDVPVVKHHRWQLWFIQFVRIVHHLTS